MISDPQRTTILSCLGWIEGDALWRFDPATSQVDLIPVKSGARYVSLHTSGDPFFALEHHFDGVRFEVSIRAFDAPTTVLARAIISKDENILTGEISLWASLPRLYTPYLSFPPYNDYVLVRISPAAGQSELHRLTWFDDSYDKDYQAIVGALEVPQQNAALVSVSRGANVVLHDFNSGQPRKFVKLSGSAGNPKLVFRESGNELWAIDYDTLVVLRTSDFTILRDRRLQGAMSGSQLFVGDLDFSPEGDLCVVARPFGGDVIALDPRTLRQRSSAKLGRQPFEVAALGNAKVIARDWKTGALLQGTLERHRWFGG